MKLGPGDLVVFYTDALIEAADATGRFLGESGLLDTARRVDLTRPEPGRHRHGLAREPSQTIADIVPPDDDMTLVVVHHNAGDTPRLSLGEKLDVYAKVFGLKSV